jgi:hypothetical protein
MGDLDDGVLDGEASGGEVEVAGLEGDQLPPPEARVTTLRSAV